MKFGPVPVGQAEGAILAHATMAGGKRLRKAHRLTAEDIALLQEAGIAEVTAAVLGTDDLDEDVAATRIAQALRTANVEMKPAATGRVNLHAEKAGIFTVDKDLIDAINGIDPAVTIATVAQYARVEAGQMVATVKIIPFAVPGPLVERASEIARGSEAFSVHPFAPRRIGLAQTVLPSLKESVLDKTARTTASRLERSSGSVTRELRPRHEQDAVAKVIGELARDNDLVLVFGASAICDEDDVIPAAIRQAGGHVERVGMPVDPGNLLVLGSLDGKPVIGAPGCARSPKLNGFDWVLDRLMAGVEVTSEDIGGMGVGGLLMEIPTRPQPRESIRKPEGDSVWAVLLAAGKSSRMGAGNKLLADFAGVPLARRTAGRIVNSKVAGTIVVTGHQANEIKRLVSNLDVKLVENPDYASGLASSLKAGIHALPADVAGALIVLADMPGITTADLDMLIEAFAASGGKAVVRAAHNGKRGNPALLPRALFGEIENLEGDTGARQVVESSPLEVIDVEIGEAASIDVDTPEALREAGGVLSPQGQ